MGEQEVKLEKWVMHSLVGKAEKLESNPNTLQSMRGF